MGWIAVPTCSPTDPGPRYRRSPAIGRPRWSTTTTSPPSARSPPALRTPSPDRLAPVHRGRPAGARRTPAAQESLLRTCCSREQLLRLLGRGRRRIPGRTDRQVPRRPRRPRSRSDLVPPPAAEVPAATSSPVRSGAAAGCRRGRRRRRRCLGRCVSQHGRDQLTLGVARPRGTERCPRLGQSRQQHPPILSCDRHRRLAIVSARAGIPGRWCGCFDVVDGLLRRAVYERWIGL